MIKWLSYRVAHQNWTYVPSPSHRNLVQQFTVGYKMIMEGLNSNSTQSQEHQHKIRPNRGTT